MVKVADDDIRELESRVAKFRLEVERAGYPKDM